MDVPAHAELVIEGQVLPKAREPEGPFGETAGDYFSDQSHVIEVTTTTHRKDPLLQALHPTSEEVALRCPPADEADILQMLHEKGFALTDLALSGASGRTHIVRSLNRRRDADARQLLHFLLAGGPVSQARGCRRRRRQRPRSSRGRVGDRYARAG